MPTAHPPSDARPDLSVNPIFTRQPMHIPRYRLPDGELDADVAYQIVHDELMLDGNARLNLATFVTTWSEPQARMLMAESLDKNMIDKDEYPRTADLENRCVHMLADLWHAPDPEHTIGCSTTGSSEACMLGGLALKRRWQARRKAAGKPADTPNLVMGANVQVCWEKFCRYWDVEMRLVPVGPDTTGLTPERAVEHCDENTIGVVAVLGSTYDGIYEPVKEIADALDKLEADTGLDVPMHVDGASGGFVAPFIDPDLEWDFRVPRVKSINASGHKYGLVYPGVGWLIFRDASKLPEDLVFSVNYLGGAQPTYTFNFSRGSAMIQAQMYNFLRLGRSGYTAIVANMLANARHLNQSLEASGKFEILNPGLAEPVVTFKLKGDPGFDVYHLSARLRENGWIVPAYSLPPDADDVKLMRIVVLAGGIGGARFLLGVRAHAKTIGAEVTAIVNVGDDVWMHGLRICPDLDSVMYTLSAFRRRVASGGREVEVDLPAGQARWVSAQEHVGENIGGTDSSGLDFALAAFDRHRRDRGGRGRRALVLGAAARPGPARFPPRRLLRAATGCCSGLTG